MRATLILNALLVTETTTEKVDVLIEDGVIAKMAHHDSPTYAAPSVPDDAVQEVIDAEGLLLFPGLIDCHVHFREPGLMQKGDMESESASAIAGGVTTVCDMPNTIPPTVTVSALQDKARRAERRGHCDIRFFFGIADIAHCMELERLWFSVDPGWKRLKERVCGVKLYFDHSTGNQGASAEVLRDAFRVCGALKIPIVAHCEDPMINAQAAERVPLKNVSDHSLRRPPASEEKAVERAIDLAKTYGTQLHIAHLSTKQGIALVRQAKAGGLRVTCEAAPHHLFLDTDDYRTLATLAKMNPPLRTPDHTEALWRGIMDHTVDCIATDHAPHTMQEKKADDLSKVPSGVPGVETMLPLLMTVASSRDQMSQTNHQILYEDIVRLCFENPNRIFRLGKKGIVEGARADLTLVDPAAEWEIRGEDLRAKCGWTPYEGWKVKGRVVRYFCRRR